MEIKMENSQKQFEYTPYLEFPNDMVREYREELYDYVKCMRNKTHKECNKFTDR